jgi:transposase-like protein
MIRVPYLVTFCPHCRSTNHVIEDTRRRGTLIVRRHDCRDCGRSFQSRQEAKQAMYHPFEFRVVSPE